MGINQIMPGVDVIQELTSKYAIRDCMVLVKYGALILFISVLACIVVCATSDHKNRYIIWIMPMLIFIAASSLCVIQYSIKTEYRIYNVIISKEADKEELYSKYIVLEDNGSTKIIKEVPKEEE